MEPGTDTTPAPEAKTPSPFVTYVKTNAKTIGVVAVVVILASGYFHQVQTNANLKKQTQHASSAATASLQAKQLTAAVGALVELPSNETPTVATVSDASKLQNQAFFANAKNGDKVLLFAKAKQAILYRPSTHKVVQIAPLNPGNAADNSGNTTVNGGSTDTSATSP